MAASSPGGLRSPRKRALEIGTDPAGFVDGVPYDTQGGHPITPELGESIYEEQEPSVSSSGATPIQGTPFKLGGA